MSPDSILYVSRTSNRNETTIAELRARLSQCTIRSTTHPENFRDIDLSTVDCIVYEQDDQVANLLQFLGGMRNGRPPVPFLLVIRPDTDKALKSVLGIEQVDVVRIGGQSNDITLLVHRIEMLLKMDRQRSELSQAENRYETLFERLTHSAVETRFDGETPVVTRVNQAFTDTFGYDSAEIVGESLDKHIVPPDRMEEAKQINRRALDGKLFSREVTRRTPTGTREFLVTTGVYDEPERFAIYTDITDQKRRKRELERKNERLDRLASVVSHDLQNPLHVAQGNLRLARDEVKSEHLDAIATAHDRMEQLLDDLLTMARHGDTAQEVEPLDLAAVAQAGWDTTQTAEATLVIETERTIRGARSQIQQLLENLFRNAIDHVGEDVTVTVGDTKGGFYISDDGPGIPAEDRDEVVEAGYSTAESTGFGLKIVEEITQVHEWKIHITDSEAGGARIEITNVEIID